MNLTGDSVVDATKASILGIPSHLWVTFTSRLSISQLFTSFRRRVRCEHSDVKDVQERCVASPKQLHCTVLYVYASYLSLFLFSTGSSHVSKFQLFHVHILRLRVYKSHSLSSSTHGMSHRPHNETQRNATPRNAMHPIPSHPVVHRMPLVPSRYAARGALVGTEEPLSAQLARRRLCRK